MISSEIKVKNLIRDGVLAGAVGMGLYMSMAWPFFRLFCYSGKKKSKSREKSKKKWFSMDHPKVNHPSYKHAEEYAKVQEWCQAQPMKHWFIRSTDGLRLHGCYLPAENPKRFVVMCHGFRGHSFGSIASEAQFLHEHDCNILLIDMRCCGDSEGTYITYGAKEQYDVLEWMGRIRKENPNRLPVYLYGQSLGATTAILAAGHTAPGELRGVIADCGYHSMRQELKEVANEWFHMKNIESLLMRVDFFCRVLAGFSMKETDTTVALRKTTYPILFFHGETDTFVNPKNTIDNYKLCASKKELVLVPDARHLCSCYEAPELYEEKMMSFFEKYDVDA